VAQPTSFEKLKPAATVEGILIEAIPAAVVRPECPSPYLQKPDKRGLFVA